MIRVAFGPAFRAHTGSWQWIGGDLAEALRSSFDVSFFGENRIGWDGGRSALAENDVVVVVKLPTYAVDMAATRKAIGAKCRIAFAPIDKFHSRDDLHAMQKTLRRCDLLIAPSAAMVDELSPFSRTRYIDHHVKFAPPEPVPYRDDGPVLWIGEADGNLPPLLAWLDQHRPAWPIRILTNKPERAAGAPNADVRKWTPEGHMQALRECRAALDVKGDEWRQRMKPPTKAIDYVATGLPLALGKHCSGVARLRDFGLRVPDPTDAERWFSREYWEETRSAATRVRTACSVEAIAAQWKEALDAL